MMLLALYIFHARRADHPILDLKLLKIPTFRGSVTGGTIFRLGIGANPFLLPLMLQDGFGYSPFQSGIVTCASAAGAFGMRTIARRVLRKFGFRSVLLWNSIIASAFIAVCGLFQPTTPQIVMMGVIFLGGVFRSLEFTALSAIAFADVESRLMSHATSFQQMAQRLSASFGVALSAFFLHQLSRDPSQVPVSAFQITFLLIGIISCTSVWTFARMSPDAGASLAGRGQVERARSRAFHA
jgi:MFS family permease